MSEATPRMPEEILEKPLCELIEDNALTLAEQFELDVISPDDFWQKDKSLQAAYVQRILDFFQITVKQFATDFFDSKTEKKSIKTLQCKIYELKVKSPRLWPNIPKSREEEFRILELAFELWLDRGPAEKERPASIINKAELDKPIPKNLLRKLFCRAAVPDRDVYSITGNQSGRFNDDEIEQIGRFCTIRAIAWSEFITMPPAAQKLYLDRLANFFITTWSDIAEYWFMGDISATALDMLAKELDVSKYSIICNMDIVKVIKKCAERKITIGSDGDTEDTSISINPEASPDNIRDTEDNSVSRPANNLHDSVDGSEKIRATEVVDEVGVKESEDSAHKSTNDEPILHPTGEVELTAPLNQEKPSYGEIDTFYSLRVELPYEGYCEIEEILQKYRRARAAKILQSSYSDLDAMSLEP